jgi:hypothetical protein
MRRVVCLCRCLLGCATLLALVPGLQANPLQHPKRVINDQTVDLSPLFHWWTNHHGARPLTGWVHITGLVMDSNPMGWIVEGKIDSARHSGGDATEGKQVKIFLRHPPLDDKAEFERLTAALQALNDEHARLMGAQAEAKQRGQTLAKEQKAARGNRGAARTLAQESRANQQAETELKNQLKSLDQQIQQTKTRLGGYPKGDHYTVDCLALECAGQYNSTPIYDHGMVWQ